LRVGAKHDRGRTRWEKKMGAMNTWPLSSSNSSRSTAFSDEVTILRVEKRCSGYGEMRTKRMMSDEGSWVPVVQELLTVLQNLREQLLENLRGH
jgi:hypothetical protein